jgi:uncharacterized protein
MGVSKVDIVKNVLSDCGIKSASFFGSYAKGNFNEKSDIDILIEFEKGQEKGLFEFIALERKLSEIFGKKVDLVTIDSVSPYIKNDIIKEKKVIY